MKSSVSRYKVISDCDDSHTMTFSWGDVRLIVSLYRQKNLRTLIYYYNHNERLE